MYKLLTQEERQKVEAEYRARRTHVALRLTAILLAFIIAALSPLLIQTLGKKNAAILALSSVEDKGESAEAQDLLTWAQSLRVKVAALTPALSSPQPYEYFEKVLKSKPANVRITSFSYTKAGNVLNAKGKAPDRQSLLQFQSNLVSSGDFSKVDFPVDNLAKESNIDFEFNITPLP